MSALILRHRIIRDVWMAVHGDDPASGKLTGPEQHRVLCPYHFERDPSCDVSIEKGTFMCRSCGASGGVLDVVVLAEHVKTRSEAIEWLASRGVRVC